MEFRLKRFENAITVSRIANIHYFEFTKQYHTFKDKHLFREMIYVDSGFILVDSEGYTGALNCGDLLIHKADETHSLSCPDDEAPNVIIIGFECNSPELDAFSCKPTQLNDIQKKLLTDIIKEGRNVFLPPYDIPNQKDMKKRKDYPFGSDQMIKIKLEAFFIELIRSCTSTENETAGESSVDKISAVCQYLNEHFRENISLSELCFLFGTNKTTLCNRFKAIHGETIVSYTNKLKIKEAKKLLRKGSHNLTEISEMIGFSSVHYFSRTFKKLENQSPTSYINTIKSRLML